MKKVKRRIFIVPAIAMLSLLFSFSPPAPLENIPDSSILAGAASINCTPCTPIPMSGYGARKDPFKGIHDSLFVKAVVFSDGTNRAAIITADVIGFSHKFCNETISKIEEATGIQHDYILLAASHNHGGPVNKAYSEEASPDVEAYVVDLQEKIIEVVRKAGKKLQPVLIGAGTGSCTMND